MSQPSPPSTGSVVPAASANPSAPPASQISKLDCTLSGRQLWLVKVPKYLSSVWEHSEDEVVGKVHIIKSATADGKLDIKLKMEESLAPDNVVDYDLNLTPFTAMKMAVLVQSGEPSGLSMDGYINRRADIRPSSAGSSQYMEIKKAQIKTALAPARTVQQTERVNNFKPVSDHIHAKRKLGEEKEVPKKVEKKLRDDKDVVMERLFAAFEKHQYINIKDLVDITNQPVGYLKELLKEFCDYNVKNPHKNMWELKAQYRHY